MQLLMRKSLNLVIRALIISNEDMNDIKIVKSTEDPGLSITKIQLNNETIKNETKKKK